MAEIWKPKPFAVYQQWIDDILEEASDDLNNWENDFISNMDTRVRNGWKLSKDQERILEKIYVEKTK